MEHMHCKTPTVFAVEDTYQIMMKTDFPTLVWVKVGDRCFYDHSNGIMRSDTEIHTVTVPAHLLDEAEAYTVCEREMTERKPYFSQTGAVCEKTYTFSPVRGDTIRAYHIADAHNQIAGPVAAARAYGDIDFLILNGDVPDHSGDVANFDNIYEICAQITYGNIPVVFSRGNHDMRGICAEKLAQYTPTHNGKSYFTVRLGGFWAVVLDCGEDKADTNEEYGNTVCCSAFRREETDFLKELIVKKSYAQSDIFCRCVICHSPFTRRFQPPFDIEDEVYDEWVSLLGEQVQPHLMICGHEHKIALDYPGDPQDVRGQTFPVAIMSETDYKTYFSGAGFAFHKDGTVEITVTDANGEIKKRYTL